MSAFNSSCSSGVKTVRLTTGMGPTSSWFRALAVKLRPDPEVPVPWVFILLLCLFEEVVNLRASSPNWFVGLGESRVVRKLGRFVWNGRNTPVVQVFVKHRSAEEHSVHPIRHHAACVPQINRVVESLAVKEHAVKGRDISSCPAVNVSSKNLAVDKHSCHILHARCVPD